MSELTFPHHNYQYPIDQGEHEFMRSDEAEGIENPRPEHIPAVGEKLRMAGVAKIVLIHGTFAGKDILGLMRELARILPGAAESLKALHKKIFDQLAGNVGNYTARFAQDLSLLINDGQDTKIPVMRFLWSGENHHIGRASGAITLIHELLQESWKRDQRILLIAHSHGGNLAALLLNLLHAERETVEHFFEITQSHYRDRLLGRFTLPVWQEVRDLFKVGEVQDRIPTLDVATFGTPPRYRWAVNDLKLLHFVQHRIQDTENPTRACLPSTISDLAQAAGGDYIQQMGIGGTDFFHSIVAWQSWRSERLLREMLEANVRRRDLPRNLAKGHRLALDGRTLLIDYPAQPKNWNAAVLGHGIYTRPEWLPFHLNQIVQRFYFGV